MVGKCPVITLCGSTRFKEQFLEAQKRLTLAGNIVISVGLFGHSGDDEVWSEGTKEMLDDMHKRKIDMADEIFVFGSNFQGAHMGGAARVAKEKFGAVWGIGEGLQGKSYAIPTMEGLENLAPAVQRFTSFAKQHKELKFYVTAIGCGIAGYQAEEIAPMFLEAAYLSNVYLPLSFWKVIMDIANQEMNSNHAAQKVLDLCAYMHRNGIPEWSVKTDRTILDSLDRHQQWQLGVLLGAISPAADTAKPSRKTSTTASSNGSTAHELSRKSSNSSKSSIS